MLYENKVQNICKVIDIKNRRTGAKLTLQANVYIEYNINGTKYNTFFLMKKGVKIGKCYEMIYYSTNTENIKVYFDKEVDCS